jgi:biopolymer transport protein ExbB
MLTKFLLDLALVGAEWVLWILVALSLVSVAMIIERAWFYWKRSVDLEALEHDLDEAFEAGELNRARDLLHKRDAMEAHVVLAGLEVIERGPDAVEDKMAGRLSNERDRYGSFLTFLGTVGNNAPFIGLFGTVLGIIGAFAELGLQGGASGANPKIMSAIAEALVATGVGLIVAIPAVIAFNMFQSSVSSAVAQTESLGRTLMSHLRGEGRLRETSSADVDEE